jgi:hypothetical protein
MNADETQGCDEGYASWMAACDDVLAGKTPQTPLPNMVGSLNGV